MSNERENGFAVSVCIDDIVDNPATKSDPVIGAVADND